MLFLNFRSLLGIALIMASTGSFANPNTVGVSFLSNFDDPTSRPLQLTLWHPSDASGSKKIIGGNAVFLGAEGIGDARPLHRQYPLVIVSHGGLRSAKNSGAWFGRRLAAEGFLAVEVNAAQPLAPTEAVENIWLRPADISRTLDALLAHPTWSQLIDNNRMAAVGFYLGGTASLMLSGIPFDESALRSSCDGEARSADCAWFASNGVALSVPHLKVIPSNLQDARFSSYIGIEPEYLHAFPVTQLEAEQAGLGIILLDGEGSSSREHRIGVHIGQANRFDGFGSCTPRGAAIIADEGGDARLCGDTALRRQGIHDGIVERVLVDFGK